MTVGHSFRMQELVTDMQVADIYQPVVPRRETRHTCRGVEFTVHEWGASDKPLMFYLHGWGDCGRTFQFVVDQLQSAWHVVAPDLRGFGDSAADVAAYWFPDYLADLDALLEIYSVDAPVRLVGHSMGGNIVGLYAAAMPERVAAFVNLEGFGLADTDPAEAPDRYRRWLLAGRAVAAFQAYPDYHSLAERISKRNPHTSAARAEFVARCWAEQQGHELVLRADPLHKLPNPVLYRRAESEACWRRVRAPVLLVEGADSALAAREHGVADAEAPELSFPNATRCTIPGSGHMLHFDAPDKLAIVIEDFFTTIP
ncbi:MAG TPA: alpha/beta hydrolase [Woeseiaceae bacterium]|nr:alpha/beta hydrolase [Woeseiaceae bacterium]